MSSDMQVLVLRAQSGEREAFGEIYQQLATKVYQHFFHRTNQSAEVAEDLTEELFLKVLTRLDRYEDRGVPFAAWVFQVARNLLVDYFRRQPRGGFVSMESAPELVESGQEGTIEQALNGRDLRQAMGGLTSAQREVVMLRFFQDLSVAETAQSIGRTEDAVKKLQERGLLRLRRTLVDRSVLRRLPVQPETFEVDPAA